jgi:hypothetical protein
MKPIVIFILLFATFSMMAQAPNDEIPKNTRPNLYLIEHLTKTKIDSLRTSLGLTKLYNDSILYLAARDHAGYLRKRELSHFQPIFEKKKTPQLRAEYYGAENYDVGENVARTIANKSISHKIKNTKNETITFQTNTYERAAHSLLISWINSPPHYANMITPEYDVTGLSVSYDSTTQSITAVQKFANVRYRYSFSNQGVLFPYAEFIPANNGVDPKDLSQVKKRSDYPWKLKPGTSKDSLYVKEKFADLTMKDYLRKEKDQYILTTRKIGGIKKILRRRKDGFAIELVMYEPFHCGNPEYYQMPSRRNDRYIFNGQVLKPVYKKEFLKLFKAEIKVNKKNRKAEYEAAKRKAYKSKEEKELALAKIKKKNIEPEIIKNIVGTYEKGSASGITEYNLLIIQKRKVAYVKHFTSTCGTHELSTPELKTYPLFDSVTIPPIFAKRTTNITVPFERNEFSLSEDEILRLRNSIPKDSILSIRLTAWASVEGLDTINLSLQNKRVETMKKIIGPLTEKKHFSVDVQSGENWNLFVAQLKETRYASYKDSSHGQIKKWLENPEILKEFESKLDAQRVARLEITTMSETDILSNPNLAYSYLNQLIKNIHDDPKASYTAYNVQAATTIQHYLFEEYRKGYFSGDKIIQLKIPREKAFIPIWINQLWFEYEHMLKNNPGGKIPNDFLGNARWTTSTDNNLAKYNASCMMVNLWKDRPYLYVEDLYDMIGSIQPPQDSTTFSSIELDSLERNFHIKRVSYYSKGNGGSKELEESLRSIYKYYDKIILNDSSCFALARYFNTYEADPLTYYTLLRNVKRDQPDLDILTMFLKLSYSHIEESDDRSYYELLEAAYNKMPQEAWCNLFRGSCSISFQVFDDERLRDFYCEKCSK